VIAGGTTAHAALVEAAAAIGFAPGPVVTPATPATQVARVGRGVVAAGTTAHAALVVTRATPRATGAVVAPLATA